MKIAILGTGIVGETIGQKLLALGHDVRIGSRTNDNEKAREFVAAHGPRGSSGTFAEAASFAELVFNCTSGQGSLPAVTAAAPGLAGKILIDLSNPLDFSAGFPPSLFVSNTESLGERLQGALPETHVVKALNHVAAAVMVDPAKVGGGDHDAFICGNDAEAKTKVTHILREWFGWQRVLDLGDISAARAAESIMPLWLRLYGSLKTSDFGLKVVKSA